MIGKEDLKLGSVERTMFITMMARARETLREDGIISDRYAVEMYEKIKDIFPTEKGDWKSETGVVVRTVILDGYIRGFIEKNPEAVCINVGAGLDTRFFRVNNEKITWYDVDLPEVIEVREKLVPHHKNKISISCDALDPRWTSEVDAGERPVLIIMEGLLMYFEEKDVKRVIHMMQRQFPNATLVLELLSEKIVKKTDMADAVSKTGAVFQWGVSSGRDVENLNANLKFIEETNLADKMYLKMGIYKMLSKISFIKNLSNRIAVFRFV